MNEQMNVKERNRLENERVKKLTCDKGVHYTSYLPWKNLDRCVVCGSTFFNEMEMYK